MIGKRNSRGWKRTCCQLEMGHQSGMQFQPGLRCRRGRRCGAVVLLGVAVMLCGGPRTATVQAQIKVQVQTRLDAPTAVDFIEDVQPVLSRNCFACHGADEAARQGSLRLDIPGDLDAVDSEATPAIVPFHPEQSELIARVTSDDADLKMPPPDTGHQLTDGQIEILRQWIAEGAVYRKHWSFERPRRPAVPQIENDEWCRHPIDHFIGQKLAEQQLSPNEPADARSLIRRVYLDLTGLPPAREAAEAFAASPTDDAYAAIVDELMQSPAFGEHWARMWLDLARYADTKGYEKDQPRTIWRYRDWVIDAFNSDMPFDQFTREQLAGDLLPNATQDQILATAFHRNTMTNDEGGTDDEEFRLAAVKDRVDTTIQVWMGLTMGCAKCHTHKYDPISQQEYYQFMAFFNQTQDEDRPDDNPRLSTPTRHQQEQLDDLQKRLDEAKTQLEASSAELSVAQRSWEAEQAGSAAWRTLIPVSAKSENGSDLNVQPDLSVLASGTLPATDQYTIVLSPWEPSAAGDEASSEVSIAAIRLEALTHASLPKKGPGRTRSDPNFVLSEFQVSVVSSEGQGGDPLVIRSAVADFAQDNWEVVKAFDGDTTTGWAISPQQGRPHVAVFELAEAAVLKNGERLQVSLSQQYAGNSLLLGCVRFSASPLAMTSLTAQLQTTAEIAAIPPDQRSPAQRKQLRDEFRKSFPATAPAWSLVQQLETEHKELQDSLPQTPIMRDRDASQLRQTFVHLRGNFLEPGDMVQPALPAAFSTSLSPSGAPAPSGALSSNSESSGNRLAVAAWLVAADNPLTSRVMVNRLWARLFGRGLVETEEDFGIQGTPPTHPELLDWLAVEFREQHRWSIKQLLKSMVMSATYRQSNRSSEQKQQMDPENRWLSRSPRFRLSAEVIRDQALSVAGLLSDRVGGPSVMPPQPEGIWKATYSSMKWETAENEDRYRRGLYTFLRRTSPYPSMMTFDAGSGEVCQIRRIRTNTPLQALVTLNDPVFVEAAGALAMRVSEPEFGNVSRQNGVGTSGHTHDAIERMFELALVRPPETQELQRLRMLHEHALAEMRESPDAASQLVKAARTEPLAVPGQDGFGPGTNDPAVRAARAALAARIVVASVILNLDELLMRP